MKTFIKAFFTITIFSFLTKILSFCLKVFLSRKIGAEAIGMMQVAMSICMVFATLSSSGLNVIVSKKTSELYEQNKNEQSFSIITACIMMSLFVCGVSITLILLFSKLIKDATNDNIFTIILYMIPSLISVSISCALSGYFWGRKKHFANSFTDFFEQFLRTILCIVLLYTAETPIKGAILATISMSIACVLSTILSLFLYLKSGGRFRKPSKSDFAILIKSSLPITAVRFISSFTHPLIAIIVPLKLENIGFSSSQALSMFGVMQGMTLPLIMIPMMLISALSTVLIPDLVRLYSKKYYIECTSIANITISFSLFISCLILPVFMSLGRPIGEFLFDNASCGVYLSKSAWIMIPNALSSITSAIMNVLNLEKKSSRNFIISTISLLVMTFFLPTIFDILSIPISMGIAMSILSILNIFTIKKELNFNLDVLSYLFKFLIIGVPAYFISYNIYGILIKYFTNIYSLIIAGFCCVISYLVLCFTFRIINVNVIMNFKSKAQLLENI